MLATVQSPLASMLVFEGCFAGLHERTPLIRSKRFDSKVSSG